MLAEGAASERRSGAEGRGQHARAGGFRGHALPLRILQRMARRQSSEDGGIGESFRGQAVKRFDVQQGTPEWDAIRSRFPTSSEFDKLVTPKELKVSKSIDKYV